MLSAIALVAIALVVGVVLAERSAISQPQPTPPLSTASPTVTASASATADASVFSDRFGFVWAPQTGVAPVKVQPETGQGGFELPKQEWRFSQCGCAASPDGIRVAYWAGSTPGAIELRVVEVARAGLGTAIYKPPADKRWSALAWSSDGNGILFSLEDWPTPGGPAGSSSGQALLVIEATGGTPRTLATGHGDYVPLGWDRSAGVAAAALSGEGGYMTGYLTVRTSGDPAPQVTAMPEPIGVLSARVSSDQRFVLGVFSTGQVTTLRWWRLADAGAMVALPGVARGVQPTWRPLSSQIAWFENGALQLFDVDRGVMSSGGTLPPGNYSMLAFRVDGSAVAAGVGASSSPWVVLNITSGGSAALASPGYIVGSVRFR